MKRLVCCVCAPALLAALVSCMIGPENTPANREAAPDRVLVRIAFEASGGEWTDENGLDLVPLYERKTSVPKGSKTPFPSKDPRCEGRAFGGWYYAPVVPIRADEAVPREQRVSSGAPVERDTTFYALWIAKPADSWELRFKQYDDDDNPIVALALRENDYRLAADALPAPKERDFWDAVTSPSFWWTKPAEGEPFNAEAAVSADTTLYGRWTGQVWKLFFDANGGSWPSGAGEGFDGYNAADKTEGGGVYIEIPYPAIRLTDAGKVIPAIKPVKKENASKNMAFLAWSQTKDARLANIGAASQIPVYTPFIPEDDVITQSGENAAWPVDGHSRTVYAVWRHIPDNALPVVFALYGGLTQTVYAALSADKKHFSVAGADFPPAPEREGYAFKGWFTTAGGQVSAGNRTPFTSATAIPAAAVQYTAYAHWEAREYTVTYQLNYGAGDEYRQARAPGKITYPAASVELPAKPVRAGWDFVQWNTKSDGTGEAFLGAGVTGDAAVYAIWALKPASSLNSPNHDGGGEQTITIPAGAAGWYRAELWGSQGGYARHIDGVLYEGGRGGYTAGEIALKAGETLYVYIGGGADKEMPGERGSQEAGYNGGGRASDQRPQGAGGGATDIRTVRAANPARPEDDAVSLAARIMVAAGGGGAVARFNSSESGDTAPRPGGDAGGLEGASGHGAAAPEGGAQSAGGASEGAGAQAGLFGKGGDAAGPPSGAGETVGGGGGGWFGGGSGSYAGGNSSGAGGSSYISGYPGCIGSTSAAGFSEKAGEPDSIARSLSLTGKVFFQPVMKSGQEKVPTPEGGWERGRRGSGFARLVYIRPSQ